MIEQDIQLTREQAEHALSVAQARLDESRIAVMVQERICIQTRGTLAKARIAWEQQQGQLTAEQLQERERRNFIAGEQAARAARGKPHGGATAFVRKNMIYGGNAHGALPYQKAIQNGFKMGDPLRVPKER
jgi:hypothetical protein